MAEVRTRDAALVAIDRGLTQWATTTIGVLTQAGAAVEGAKTTADCEVRKWATKTTALESRLTALRENQDPQAVMAELSRARQSLQTARDAANRIEHVAQQVALLQRTHAQRTTSLVDQARADLSRRTGELGAYRGAGSGSTGLRAPGSTGAAEAPSPSPTLANKGLGEVDVGAATFADNPIVGAFGRGDTGRADYRWAVQTWDEVVRPGISRGMTRQDFERRDAERGAKPLRSTAAVYDLFLGDTDRIRVSRQTDGTLDVANGRHRLQIAHELGIRTLPGEITG